MTGQRLTQLKLTKLMLTTLLISMLIINNFETCHPLPRGKETDQPWSRFVNQKHRLALMKQRKHLKGFAAYLSDLLTRRNAEITNKALRKRQKIQNNWVRNWKIFLKPHRPPERIKVLGNQQHGRLVEMLDRGFLSKQIQEDIVEGNIISWKLL